jgi:hypothetical protein
VICEPPLDASCETWSSANSRLRRSRDAVTARR